MHDIAWRLVNALMTEYCPTWCIAVQNRKLSTASQLYLRLVIGDEPLNTFNFWWQDLATSPIIRQFPWTFVLTSTSGMDDTTDNTGIMEARLQPWLSDVLAGFNNGCRRPESEMVIALCNLTTQGVLSVERLHFLLQQITALSHAYPKNFVAVVVMPNRAGDLKANGCKPLSYFTKYFLSHDFKLKLQ